SSTSNALPKVPVGCGLAVVSVQLSSADTADEGVVAIVFPPLGKSRFDRRGGAFADLLFTVTCCPSQSQHIPKPLAHFHQMRAGSLRPNLLRRELKGAISLGLTGDDAIRLILNSQIEFH
ncbi:MAG: hypothetical protein AAFO68_11380, partial [Pseudomonadota bacterium]